MRELDGDTVGLTDSSDRPASRDIVQFVPMCNFHDRDFFALAREVKLLTLICALLKSVLW